MVDRLSAQRLSVARDEPVRVAQPIGPRLSEPVAAPRQPAPTPATPSAPAPPTPAPLPDVPAPPGDSPFDNLPFPSPGDRIKADDFRILSLSLRLIHDAYMLSSVLCGRTFAEAKLVLASQHYNIERVISVFGAELAHAGDTSLDSRKVLQVIPTAPGEQRVIVVLTEMVEMRRFMPNLVNKSYSAAGAELRAVIGDAALGGASITTPDLVNRSVADAREVLNRR